MHRYIPKVLSIQSHVVFGHAGNSSACFPMSRLGINVLPLNTVQYSNHTQYKEKWTGLIMPPGHITSIGEGLANINKLQAIDAVLSGYIGSEKQAEEILQLVQNIKKVNPNVVYLCDPVMGNEEKGCVVPKDVTEFIAKNMTTSCDYLCPNQLEVNTFLNEKPSDFHHCVEMAVKLFKQSRNVSGSPCKALLVKNLNYPGKDANKFEMLLITTSPQNVLTFPHRQSSTSETSPICDSSPVSNEKLDQGKVSIYLTSRPLFPFNNQPVGVGDLTSGVFLSKLLSGDNQVKALEYTTSAVYHVMQETFNRNSYELELIASQDLIAAPKSIIPAQNITSLLNL